MKNVIFLFVVLFSITIVAQDKEPEMSWPREIDVKDHTITLYQPQVESLKGNILEGRMAISIKDTKDQMLFGALWYKVRLSTNTETRMASLEAIEIPRIVFADIENDENIEKLKKVITDDIKENAIEMSIDRIIADLEEVEEVNSLQEQFNNKAPNIYFRTTPTVLVSIDGDPILKEIENSSMEYVVNTPFLILKEKGVYYLKGGNYWYKSSQVVGTNWKTTTKVPKDVKNFAEQNLKDKDQEGAPENVLDEIPSIIAVSEPSELVVSDGELEYEPIEGTELLFVTNSESDILLEIKTQRHFLLLNGRWYATKNLKDASWSFIEPENLPKEFASIPSEGTTISSVRTSIPGTPEAEEAKYEQYIPQTAVVDKKTATATVTYDGEPKFEKIEGTTMQYAVNTQSTVLLLDSVYYCVDEGVWFQSTTAKGPWSVSDARPDEVEKIPPSSPVYNVKYVYVYESTPEVVYVGYTPGYYNAYMYGGVVVYGTGFYYRPWYGYYYYPRPVTYGFGVHYNPYTGWGFSVGVSYGWLTISAHSGYWGPAGYRHGYRHGYYHGYHHGYHNGYRAGYNRGRNNATSNVYRGRSNGVRQTGNLGRSNSRPSTRPSTGRNTNAKTRPSTSRPSTSRPSTSRPSTRPSTSTRNRPQNKSNNIYTDRSGNVYQRNSNGTWNQKSNQRTNNTSRNISRDRQQQLNRSYNNRSRGTQNYNNYNRTRSSNMNRSSRPSRPAPSRGGGGMRRGGRG